MRSVVTQRAPLLVYRSALVFNWLRPRSGQSLTGKKEDFFFEKKKQKTLLCRSCHAAHICVTLRGVR